MDIYKLFAAEPQLDGPDHVFDAEYCATMKLPFHYGWDHWRIYQGENLVFQSPNFTAVRRQLQALNSIQLLPAAA